MQIKRSFQAERSCFNSVLWPRANATPLSEDSVWIFALYNLLYVISICKLWTEPFFSVNVRTLLRSFFGNWTVENEAKLFWCTIVSSRALHPKLASHWLLWMLLFALTEIFESSDSPLTSVSWGSQVPGSNFFFF